jgi:hypothetical protein
MFTKKSSQVKKKLINQWGKNIVLNLRSLGAGEDGWPLFAWPKSLSAEPEKQAMKAFTVDLKAFRMLPTTAAQHAPTAYLAFVVVVDGTGSLGGVCTLLF